ncbi:HD-GYP domain-containing protein [Candidatus Omnitrophota bacterium]
MKFYFQKRLRFSFITLLVWTYFIAFSWLYIFGEPITRNIIIAFSIGLISSSIGAYFIVRHFSRKIERLATAARIISKGDFDYRLAHKSDDEIGMVADTLEDMAQQLESTYKDLEVYFLASIHSLVNALEAKDRFTQGHSERVTRYATLIAQEIKLSDSQVEFIRTVGLLHDIGKIGVSERILSKVDPLTDREWNEIRRHPVIGVDILSDINMVRPALSIVKSHHERPDGKGYPEGLSADEIPTLASIISVADAFDAMCTERPYRQALSIEEAKQELVNHKGMQFREDVVDVFLKLIEEGRMRR